jgi:hypothetical protein
MKPELQGNRALVAPAGSRGRGTLGRIAAVGFGILLMAAGVMAAQAQWWLGGGVVVAGAALGWWLTQRRDAEVPSETLFEVLTQQVPPPDEARGRELLAMLEEWEALEGKRGTPEFDPWALQSLRNDIRKAVESDPALAQLFSELQRAA